MPRASHHLRGLGSRWRELRRSRADARFVPRVRRGEGPSLLLSPHLDDAVLDCWSVLSGDAPPRVVNVFAGIPTTGAPVPLWDRVTGAGDSAARVRVRIQEDARALARAGLQPTNLALLDAQYRRPGNPLEPGEIDGALAAEMDGASAHVLAPAAIGGHPDHVLVRRYARLLLQAGFAVTLYADLPYCLLHGWPSWVDGREPDERRDIDAFWSSFLDAVSELGPLRSARVVRLDDERAAAKLAAMRSTRPSSPPSPTAVVICWPIQRSIATRSSGISPRAGAAERAASYSSATAVAPPGRRTEERRPRWRLQPTPSRCEAVTAGRPPTWTTSGTAPASARSARRSALAPSASTRSCSRRASKPASTSTSARRSCTSSTRGIQMEFGDGRTETIPAGGFAWVDAPVARKIRNAGDTDAIYVIVGAKDGYVGRDGRVPEGEEERVRALHDLRGGEG